ncbi:PH domain-containing protein [Streptomyces sp. NPDC058401]|uniref:PH domain-containing protein n=1 Tax=Streptomyces sp. NPDC058401 TaxID=3346480 RepID=UPI00366862B3
MPDIALPRRYRAKPPWGLGVLLFGSFGLFLLKVGVETSVPGWGTALLGVLLAGFCAGALYVRTRCFATVDRQGIIVRRTFRVRRFAWDDIHDIRTVNAPPGDRGIAPGTSAYLYRTDGRRMILPFLDDNEMTGVEQEVEGLRSLLTEHRRADWAPDPQAEPRIARQAARWESGHRYAVVTGIVLVVLALIVFLTGS